MGARHGQHFLRSRGIIDAILARFSPAPDQRIVEIGPGRGALTLPLAERAGPFAAVEIDAALATALAQRIEGAALLSWMPPGRSGAPRKASDGIERSVPGAARPPRFIIEADALEIRYEDLARLLGASEAAPLRVIGNLPYGVATALIQRIVAERVLVADALVMVQSEVADRLVASPGRKAYGFLSVLLALTAERDRVLSIPPGAFSPPPAVRSSVVALRFHRPDSGFAARDARLVALLKIAFAERRKKLTANLARGYALARAEAADIVRSSGADPGARAEALEPEAFVRLADLLPAPAAGGRRTSQARRSR